MYIHIYIILCVYLWWWFWIEVFGGGGNKPDSVLCLSAQGHFLSALSVSTIQRWYTTEREKKKEFFFSFFPNKINKKHNEIERFYFWVFIAYRVALPFRKHIHTRPWPCLWTKLRLQELLASDLKGLFLFFSFLVLVAFDFWCPKTPLSLFASCVEDLCWGWTVGSYEGRWRGIVGQSWFPWVALEAPSKCHW